VALALLGTASPAAWGASHVVQPGESLWSIASQDGISPAALAAANGLAGRPLLAGSTIHIPPQGLAGSSAATTASPGGGSYSVRPGDTLSTIAAREGLTTTELASENALDPRAPLLSGTVLRLGGGTVTRSAAGPGGPVPTAVRVSGDEVGAIAARNGVPPSLARAIAWQESGFNNGVVSSANARGVMQIVPSTWSWIQHNLALAPLDPASAADNVKAGSLLLGQLLRDTGGNEPAAIAGYYQGLDSVRRIGMLPDTRRYVANVLALQGR
jgi:LysM repeat protein